MNPAESDNALTGAYRHTVRELLYRRTRVGYVLVLILMPAGAILDYFMLYPRELAFWYVIEARLLCTVCLIPFFALLLSDSGKRHAWLLSCVLIVMPVLTMSWMIYITNGVESSYYAGLNLMIIGACQLLPYTVWQAGAYCAVVIATYAAACIWHTGEPFRLSLFDNNLFFIGLTTIICATFCHVSSRLRFEEFRLRHELDERNRQLNQSYEKLAELDRLKSQFFANISHELRTPLTLILSPIETLLHREPSLPQEVGHWLVIAKNNGLRLLKLINDLLEIIRLEEGKLKIDLKPIDLSRFVPGIVQSVQHLARSKNLALHATGPDTPLTIRGDCSRLEKVLLNLLTNAIKFTQSGGRIDVRWHAQHEYAVIDVQDNGIGIPTQELPYVFDRFRQVDGSSTRKHQGVGLGLALARELIEEHQGRLEARSALGAGATFTIHLPLQAITENKPPPEPDHLTHAEFQPLDPISDTFRAADRAAPGIHSHAHADATEIGRGEHRILVIDDEADMRAYLVSILQEDYRIIQAADGADGLELAKRLQPDLVLLDLMLPGMDGLAVCRALRKQHETQHTKIVLLTARVDEGSKIEGLERGADDFITKPFSSIEIKTRLKNLLNTAKLQHDLKQRNNQLEQTLRQLKATEAQLIQAEKMNALGSLAAGLLHEINNPLNYTLTALELADMSVQQLKDDDLRETLNDIGEGMRRIRDIITDLRTFAYPQQGDHRERFTLDQALETALRFTAQQRNGHLVNTELAPGAAVVASRTQITQVLVNLITNALRAIEPLHDQREGRIRVSAQPREGRLEVCVSDNGIGIKPDVRSRIFEPFYTTRDIGQGMGLGLSICHTIVRNHDGHIRVHSQPGHGAEFRFDLPLAKEES